MTISTENSLDDEIMTILKMEIGSLLDFPLFAPEINVLKIQHKSRPPIRSASKDCKGSSNPAQILVNTS